MLRLYYRRPNLAWVARGESAEDCDIRPLALDVHSDEKEYLITADVPGLRPEDLSIQVLDDVLTLRGEKKAPENGNGRYLLRERSFGTFERKLHLDEPVDAKGAEAKIEDGILILHLPKSEEARPRVIEVRAK
jgi:HSP20 family protein